MTNADSYTYRYLIVGRGPATDLRIRDAESAPDLAQRAVALGLLDWSDNDYAVLVEEASEDHESFVQYPKGSDDPSIRHIIPVFGNADDTPSFLPSIAYSIRSGIPAREWYEFDSDAFLDELRQVARTSLDDDPGWIAALAAEARGERIFYARNEDGWWFGIDAREQR